MHYFDYFQISTLIIFLAIFFARSLWLEHKGTQVFRLGSGKKGLAAFLEKIFLVFFPLWIFEVFVHSLHVNFHLLPAVMINPFFNHTALRIAGIALNIGGILIFILSLASFKSSWRVGIDTIAPGELVTTGIFSFSRNPIFLSMNLYFLGTFMIYSNLFFLLSFIGMAAGFHKQIRNEEIFLAEKYGGAYQGYISRVRRYI